MHPEVKPVDKNLSILAKNRLDGFSNDKVEYSYVWVHHALKLIKDRGFTKSEVIAYLKEAEVRKSYDVLDNPYGWSSFQELISMSKHGHLGKVKADNRDKYPFYLDSFREDVIVDGKVVVDHNKVRDAVAEYKGKHRVFRKKQRSARKVN